MITPFLIIRSVSNIALTVIYIFLAREEQKSTAVVTGVLLGITSVVIYVGLVVIAFEKDWDVRNINRLVNGAYHLNNEADGNLFHRF
jgi:hypothetical protein